MGKRNLIVTCADARAGDFAATHWLRSIQTNVDLTDTDVVVLDYGLTAPQREILSSGARVVPCKRDGAIVAIRFRDVAQFLREHSYEQILMSDGGDVIFQKDISELFERHTHQFRAVCEETWLPSHTIGMFKKFVSPQALALIERHYTAEKKVINAGMIVGPRIAFIELCEFTYENITDKSAYGPDQVLVTSFLYQRGFFDIGRMYNFIFYTVDSTFSVRDGVFVDGSGEIISIVHNAGRYASLRAISNFGFGPACNRVRPIRYLLLRAMTKLAHRARLRAA